MLSRIRLVLNVAVAVVFALAIWRATDFPALAAQFPLLIAAGGLFFALISLVRDFRNHVLHGTAIRGDVMDTASLSEMMAGVETDSTVDTSLAGAFLWVGRYVAWIAGYVVAIWFLGLVPASAIFVGLFLYFEAQLGVMRPIVAALVVGIGLVFLSDLLSAPWPHTIWD